MNAKRLLVIGSFALMLTLSGCGVNPSSSENPTDAGEQSTSSLSAPTCLEPTEAYVFDSLDEMTATVDLVVVGTAAETTVGRVIPDPAGSGRSYLDPWNTTQDGTVAPPPPLPEESEDDTVEEYPTRFFDTTLRVEEVLKGTVPAADEITVETLEAAYCRPTEWRETGTHVLLFLSRSEERSVYVPKNITQSAYIIRGDDLIAARNDRFVPLVERVASLSLPRLILRVEEAKENIESGEVTALPEVR